MGGGKIYTEIRQKNKLLYLLLRLGFGRSGLAGVGLEWEVGGWGLRIGGFILAGFALVWLAGEVGGYGLGLRGDGGEKVTEKFFIFGELGDLVA